MAMLLPISDELRLDWGSLDLAELDRLAAIAARPKLLRAVRRIRALTQDARRWDTKQL